MTSATPSFAPLLQLGLPLPLSRLYARAHNAKGERERHDYAFHLLEAGLKLTASALVARYRASGQRSEKVDAALGHLPLPSLGQWLSIFRETLLFLGKPPTSDPWAQRILDRAGKVQGGKALEDVFASMAAAMAYAGRATSRLTVIDCLDLLPAYRNVMSDAHGSIKAD